MKIQKQLIWVSSSYKDLVAFPHGVIDTMGYALHLAQSGELYKNTKILKGFRGAGVIEIVDTHSSGTYRVMYTVIFPEVVFVLHAFQKKSKEGIKTPKKEMDLVDMRLKQAEEIYQALYKKK